MKPNILFTFTDEHCHNLVGCADHPTIQTSNLDPPADQGALFSKVWCKVQSASRPGHQSLPAVTPNLRTV